jgi:hypothetical protein
MKKKDKKINNAKESEINCSQDGPAGAGRKFRISSSFLSISASFLSIIACFLARSSALVVWRSSILISLILILRSFISRFKSAVLSSSRSAALSRYPAVPRISVISASISSLRNSSSSIENDRRKTARIFKGHQISVSVPKFAAQMKDFSSKSCEHFLFTKWRWTQTDFRNY